MLLEIVPSKATLQVQTQPSTAGAGAGANVASTAQPSHDSLTVVSTSVKSPLSITQDQAADLGMLAGCRESSTVC
jgi:hypothetical protein